MNNEAMLLPGTEVETREDIFVRIAGKHVFRGVRKSLVVIFNVRGAYAMCDIIRSSGAQAYLPGARVPIRKNILMQGRLSKSVDMPLLKSGGYLTGEENGKEVVLDDASKGGFAVGSKHSEGGIKGAVGTEQRPIEFEGKEIILTAPVADNPEKYEFEGEMLTGREIASRINVDNGGVSFADGGEVKKCRCSGRTYRLGGHVVTDNDVLEYLQFMSKSVQDRILHLKGNK